NQDIPFEQVVELVQPVRSLAHAPLFQVMVTWQNASEDRRELPGLRVGGVGPAGPASQPAAKFDLSLSLGEAGGRIVGSATYATALFERATVERWLGYLRRVLHAMAADDARAVDRLDLLDAAERSLVLEEWNRTGAELPRACVHERFEAQVARTPGSVAVVFEGRSLTYAELNGHANRLAHHLRGRGVGPDVRVAVCIERSPELIIAFLAVLKAGGAYVPLDPGDPEERLRHMLDDGAPAALLVHAGTAARFAGEALPVIDLDAGAREWAGEPAANPAREEVGLRLGHLAYVIYTSGSTGRPKGVMVEHRALANVMGWMGEAWPLGAHDVVLQKTPVSFDASARELFPPLLAGARMVIARPGGHRDPAYLAETIRREGVTTLHFVPTMLGFLLEEPGIERCTSIARVVCGGEALPAALARRAAELLPHAELHNVYGPTEAAVDVTWLRCPADVAGPHLSIGRPMAGCRAYFLDRTGEPVPAGVAGELYLGGVQVARGYLGRAALTAERFVPDPFGGAPGARLYRTGDLGRWRPDGTIEFRGRNDFQVKVRGFRIELGEIEARLREHEGVREAVVVARENEAGDRRLVAYWTGEERVEAEALRRHAGERLAEHMVPAAYVRLEALPLTSSGKLDRKALPAPEGDAFATRGYEAPASETEQALAEVWSELLGVEQVGRRDHFFELGGHSLLAVRVISRVRQLLGVEVSLGELFRSPVLAELARAVENAARTELPPIERVDRGGRLPLSFAQQRLWFLERLGDLGSTYHVPRRLRLGGELDRVALARALDAIVARHEALRTTVVEVEGEPVQRIAEESRFHLLEHDLGGHANAAAELSRLAADEAGAPFDLEHGPLIRGRLVRLSADDHVLLLTLHHIVSDGWSAGVLARELGTLYDAFRRGEENPLPPLPIQYADYAAWQRKWVADEVLREQAEYWKTALAGAPGLLELPTDHPRPARQDHAGAYVGVNLDEALTAGLRSLSQRHGTTLFMTLLAGWAAVLSRLSGQADVVVGTPTANRGRAEIEGLIGFFVNTLALRVDLSGSPTVAELLEQVRARSLGAQQNQDIPFEQVVELVQPARSMAHTPLFQVMLSWQNASEDRLELSGLTLGGVGPAPSQVAAKFDLSLSLGEADGRVVGSVTYATALFERATVERYLGYLRRVLGQMVADDAQAVDRLGLLDEAERSQALEEWNRTEADVSRDTCVHALFEAQVARTPDALAVVFDGHSLTYAELNARANRLAHHLRALGVVPDARVAVCVERGPAMIVGLMGVLKAGGAYVPLDPAYPGARLRHMLEDSAPAALLTEARLAGVMGEILGGLPLPVIHLDDGAEWESRPAANPVVAGLTPDHLMYVIYTSGSTGQPKGVMNQHRCVVNRLAWGREAWGPEAGEAVLQNASFSFDVAAREIFWPLMAGGRVVLPRPEDVRDPGRLVETIRREAVRTACFVPSMLQLFLEHPEAGSCSGLAQVVCSGEALPAAVARRFRERLPGVALHNVYGPSEAATATAALHCVADDARATIPIGRPVSNTRVYLLDGAGEPVPRGVAGELYVGGTGVARGYFGRPGLTAERFVPDPFSARPGARLYRTGDLARRLPDGAIEFLGRNDFQVKVRGFRVELGEIEARIAAYPGVREAAVVARHDVEGDTRLVAYLVGADPVEADALRRSLAERLPEHMVPAAYVRLEAFPLTPNGKLDRRALPAPDADAFAASRRHEPPLGDTEEALAEIWSELLGVERVGRWDDFFALGGHSLRAVQVISRVRQTLGLQAALGDLFLRPVLADFARGMDEAGRVDLPPIEPVERTGRLPLSFAQQRLWFLEQMGGMGSTYHIPRRLRLRGDLDADALARALERIVARHEALRTTFHAGGGEPEQRIAPAGESGFQLAGHDLSADPAAGPELRRLIDEEARAPFDLERGPLIRGRLVRLAADDHVLLLTMHHIVSDGWSSGVLTRELGTLYDAFRRGREDPLAPLPVQYADYAAWQRKWVDGEVLREQAEYWKAALAGAPELLELPTDRPRPARQDHAGAIVAIDLGDELSAGLKALSHRRGTTLHMTLLAGWAAVLGRLSGHDDVVVGTPSANRGRREIEGLIGFFVNTLALRVELGGSPSVADLLGRVRERALEAQQHQDIPFEQVVELVQPVRSMAHTPLFQVMFAWQNASEGRLELPGLRVEGVGAASPRVAAKFDLSLSLGEADGRIAGSVTYATALFEQATVERWVGCLRRVLQAMAADDTRPADRLELLPDHERRLVVEEWNHTEADYPRELCIHHLFEAQAARTPGAVAVVHDGEALTYAELNARANRLAHHLIGRGVGVGARVAVLVPRSTQLVVAELAVLKTGAAYVPIDPSFPAGRIAFMAADSGARVVLARSGDPLPPEIAGVPRVDVDVLPEGPSHDPRIPLQSEAAAYVMYTSGSTGEPKGVLVPHRAIGRLVINNGYADFGADDRVAFAANPAFDASTMEVWAPLLNGGRIVVIPQDVLLDARRFADALNRHGVDVLWMTVGLFNQYAEE
ncbi:MAG TPA: amino acid adenylation domain-containing protein, partial [Longimicrobium sp.]